MDPRVQMILRLMRQELHRDLTLDELARRVNLSTSYLHHLFKAEIGISPWMHLNTLRMERARDLLVTTMLSVKQVMVCVGMRDVSHFSREFKKAYGKPPGRYRMSARLNAYTDSIRRG